MKNAPLTVNGWMPQVRPQQADALFNKALALHQTGQLAAALPLYEQVIQLQPRHADALHLAGVICLQGGQAQRAVDLITRAIKVDRLNASAHSNRGAACEALGQFDLAMLNYNKAIELKPELDSAWNNRAGLMMKLERNEDALADVNRALSLQPDSFEAHNNRGNALSRMRRYAEATPSYERAVQLNPQSAAARWNLGMHLLRLGDFARGWQHAEARLDHWRARGWQGERGGDRLTAQTPLEGATVLLYKEQGLGDTIQFSRYARVLHERGAQVVLEVQPELAELLAPLYPFAQVVSDGQALPAFTHSCPLLSAPLACQTTLDTIPAVDTGLRAPTAAADLWRERIGPRTQPRVGVVWSGNAQHIDDAARSIPLATFQPLLAPGVEWVSLQPTVRDADAPVLATLPALRQFGAELRTFSDTAALIEQLDLVVCVDTSVAHLAATLGKPVWLLLPFNADWRWLTDRSDTPWYPGMTLYRQSARGDWPELLERVGADLRARFDLNP